MSTPRPTIESLARALSVGERLDRGERFLPDAPDVPDAFARVAGAFALDGAERAALAWCVFRARELRAFPGPEELCAVCRTLGHTGPLSLLFDPEAGAVLRTACGGLCGRPVRLPEHLRLEACEERRIYRGEELLARAGRFLDACAAEGGPAPALVALTGQRGSGRKFLLGELCRRRGCVMLVCDCARMTPRDLPEAAGMALLFDALVCLDGYDSRGQELAAGLFDWFSVLLACGASAPVPDGCRALFEREVPPLTRAERRAAMADLFGDAAEPDALDEAAGLCRASVGGLVRAAARLRGERAAGGDAPGRLRELLRRENGAALSENARELRAGKRLCDLVLPGESARQLERFCAFARGQDTVWKQWRFEDKIPDGRGLSALFYGASGTGKTLAASAVAGELGLALYRVDLSQLISKYIGETQKNLGRLFDEAAGADCILFFDEADALFSRRSDANDAQDRYANAEIAYLLQRMEEYDGIVLLATNLLQNFDEAFRRRIGFMIHFPVPDESLRVRLWETIFPPEAPAEGVDCALLAQKLELTGAGVRSCALGAARLAAAAGGGITMDRVAAAAKTEYQKLGKPFPPELGRMISAEGSR